KGGFVALSTVEKAVKLTEIGLYVLPWKMTANGDKVPLLPHGHTQATNDPETAAVWFSVDFHDAQIGVNAGASGLVILDLDKKNGLDGEQAINGWVDVPDTWKYDTPTGARHHIYTDPGTATLAPARNYQ